MISEPYKSTKTLDVTHADRSNSDQGAPSFQSSSLRKYNENNLSVHQKEQHKITMPSTMDYINNRRQIVEAMTTPNIFRDICLDYFFSTQVTQDLKIDNEEVAFFFTFLCQEVSTPGPSCQDTSLTFEGLPVDIQIEFLNLICPPNQHTNGMSYQKCISQLRDDVNNSRQIVYQMSGQTSDDFQDIEGYCSSLFCISTEFHGPSSTCSTTPTASNQPTAAPNKSIPSNQPTVPNEPSASTQPSASNQPTVPNEPSASNQPTVPNEPSASNQPTVPNEPSASTQPSASNQPTVPNQPSASNRPTQAPNTSPTSKPTKHRIPTVSPAPSISPQPTGLFQYQRSFTYKMAFNNPDVQVSILQNTRLDIMDSTSNAIVNILTVRSPNIVDPSSSRPLGLMTFSTNGSHDFVEHLLRRNEPCEPDFPSSYRCIAIVSEVYLESLTEIETQLVNETVFSTLRGAMNNDNSFLDAGVHSDVIGVKYMNDGGYILPRIETYFPGGAIAGIAIGSVILGLIVLFFCLGFIGGRSTMDNSSIDSDQSFESEDVYEDNVANTKGNDDDVSEDNFSEMKNNSVVLDDNSYVEVLEKFEDNDIVNEEDLDSEYLQSITTKSYPNLYPTV